jgi:hypothetical protein
MRATPPHAEEELDMVALLAQLCLPNLQRTLALMDRDPTSPTYGSMDRSYWYYRTLTNFPGAIWQQPMVALAALADVRHETKQHHGDPQLIEAATAALFAWTKCQHRSGAFDEWYRNESSYCPTAITTAGAVVTLELLGDRIDEGARNRVMGSARRAGRWLAPRYNRGVMNQNIAAAVALAGLARLDGGAEWHGRATSLLEKIGRDQSREGWFPEYGGFDFGYSTLALDLLALAGSFEFEHLTHPMAERLARFLLNVVEPDKAVPARLGSRGTGHAFLFGAISMSARVPSAEMLASRLLALHSAGLAASPSGVDDRYFAGFYFPAFALAYRAACGLEAVPSARRADAPPCEIAHADSGLAIRRQSGTTLVMSHRRGGATALLRRDLPPLYHLGYTVTKGGRRYSSAGWREDAAGDLADGQQASATFSKVSGELPLHWFSIPFQIAVHLLITSRLAECFQAVIKRAMINPKQKIALSMDRRVAFAGECIIIEDLLRVDRPLRIDGIEVTAQVPMHSPSARQDDGTVCIMSAEARAAVLSALGDGKPITLRWSLSTTTGESSVQIED